MTDDLTKKQREVMELICNGKSNEEIAAIMGNCLGTVKTHIRMCYAKLDAHNKALAVAKYLKPERFEK